MPNFDRTFCMSPACQNRCKRKMDDEHKSFLKTESEKFGFDRPISYSYFCGDDGELLSPEEVNNYFNNKIGKLNHG